MVEKPLRSPICTVLGHVDHGKSSVLDYIRSSAITKAEPGAITQAIGASIVPLTTIKKICGELLSEKIQFTIPGLVFIDTPGHAAFTSLRKRGGNLADIAILVVDMNEGFKPQTIESIEILRSYKTPFVIAANKIDLIPGWRASKAMLLKNIAEQAPSVIDHLDKKMYEIVGSLYEKFAMSAERFDRVEDYTKQIAIVPVSAVTGEGIPELLMVIAGLAQRYLESCLSCDVAGLAKGTVLEVKEEKGIGTSLDVIVYDGVLRKNDMIVIGGINEPIVTKVRALFQPAPLAEMRDKKTKFTSVNEVIAASGVKIAAPNIEGAVAGMPLRGATEDTIDAIKEEVQQEVQSAFIETDANGIIVKADSLGALEAIANILREKNVSIQRASIGDISKKDISDAEANNDPMHAIILGFNVKDESKLCPAKAKIITDNVIYALLDKFTAWQQDVLALQNAAQLDNVVKPCKIRIMKGYVFRQSNPAIVGVDILEGSLSTGTKVFKDIKPIATVKNIQHEKENLSIAEKGKQVAVAFEGVTIGRQVNEGDILYAEISEQEFRMLKEYKKKLSSGEIEVLKEVAEKKREQNPTWGI